MRTKNANGTPKWYRQSNYATQTGTKKAHFLYWLEYRVSSLYNVVAIDSMQPQCQKDHSEQKLEIPDFVKFLSICCHILFT